MNHAIDKKSGATPITLTVFAQRREKTYLLRRLIGASDLSSVYMGHQVESPERPIAAKVYEPRALNVRRSDVSRERGAPHWLAEARTTEIPTHPGIVDIYWVGRGQFSEGKPTDGPRAITLLDGIPGYSLKSAFDAYEGSTVPEPPLKSFSVLDFCNNVLGSLGFLHTRGFLFTDLKPSHIMMRRKGRALPRETVLVDRSGILNPRKAQGPLISNGIFRSPEMGRVFEDDLSGRERQRRVSALTPASDIFAFGVLLCGMRSWNDELSIGLEFPEPVNEFQNRALETDPSKRPQSARAALRILNR